LLSKPGRLGRVQLQAYRCFVAEGDALSSDLAEWCWPHAILIECRPNTLHERQSMCRDEARGLIPAHPDCRCAFVITRASIEA